MSTDAALAYLRQRLSGDPALTKIMMERWALEDLQRYVVALEKNLADAQSDIAGAHIAYRTVLAAVREET